MKWTLEAAPGPAAHRVWMREICRDVRQRTSVGIAPFAVATKDSISRETKLNTLENRLDESPPLSVDGMGLFGWFKALVDTGPGVERFGGSPLT